MNDLFMECQDDLLILYFGGLNCYHVEVHLVVIYNAQLNLQIEDKKSRKPFFIRASSSWAEAECFYFFFYNLKLKIFLRLLAVM